MLMNFDLAKTSFENGHVARQSTLDAQTAKFDGNFGISWTWLMFLSTSSALQTWISVHWNIIHWQCNSVCLIVNASALVRVTLLRKKSSRSSHESHHVGRTVVQLSRDIEVIWISLRETEHKLPFSRNKVDFQDFLLMAFALQKPVC